MSSRCVWCGLVRVGKAWVHERRWTREEVYTHGICDRCKAAHFALPPETALPGDWHLEERR